MLLAVFPFFDVADDMPLCYMVYAFCHKFEMKTFAIWSQYNAWFSINGHAH